VFNAGPRIMPKLSLAPLAEKVGTTRSRVTFSLNKAGLHRVRRWRPAQDQLLAAERRVARM